MNKTVQMLSVSAPPFWHCGLTINTYMRQTFFALLPAAFFALITWGLPALRVMCLSITVCVLSELFAKKVMNRKITLDNFSAINIGLLFSFLMPADAAWWVVSFGAFLSVIIGKSIFGDLGSSPLCAPVVGFLLCSLSFPLYTDPNTVQLSTELVDPLIRLKYFGTDATSPSFFSLLIGQQISALGAGQVLMLALGGIYLCVRGFLAWQIPVSFLLGVFITSLLFYIVNSEVYANPIFNLCTGSTMLAAFFLATDISSSPNKHINMLIYGAVTGILAVLIRSFGVYPDGIPFAILVSSMIITPLLESRKQKPIGME